MLSKINQGRSQFQGVRDQVIGGLCVGSFSIVFCLRILLEYTKTKREIAELKSENLKKDLELIRKKAIAEALEIIKEKEENKEMKIDDDKSEAETIESEVSDPSDNVVEISKDDLADHNYNIENSVVYITNNERFMSSAPAPLVRHQQQSFSSHQKSLSEPQSFSYNVPSHLESDQDEDINKMLVYKLRK